MSDEVRKSQSAASSAAVTPSIFTRIINKEIPSEFIHEDDKCVAIRDVNPVAPVHFLVVPRKEITTLDSVEEQDEALLGHMMMVVSKLAQKEKLEDGFRVVINNGKDGAQSVYHLHIHVMGGRQMGWPPG